MLEFQMNMPAVMSNPELWSAVLSRDASRDGSFVFAVRSTGIYCRPSCPARRPNREQVSFFKLPEAAEQAGFRACKRCRPDAAPGSPEWNLRADAVGRAMRLIRDGAVEREGVTGLARRLGFSERHLHRQLVAELGAGPLSLARAQRAQTARLLIETTTLPFTDVAFAAGFPSIRQFNETVREVFATTPTQLRRSARRNGHGEAPTGLTLRLRNRAPFDAPALLTFLGTRAVPGVEAWDPDPGGRTYRRVLALPHGPGVAKLAPGGADAADPHVRCELRLSDLRDLAAAVQRCRRLLDLDADPVAIDDALASDPLLAPLVQQAPGRRVPGAVDGAELAVRAVLGQQVSVAGARTLAGRLTAALGEPLAEGLADAQLTHAFPTAEAIAAADPAELPLTRARTHALRTLCGAVADGTLALHPGADRDATRERLLTLPGIGPWTAEYVAMRALGDPDAFPATDLGVKKALERLGSSTNPDRWRPWRAYAVQHLWASLAAAAPLPPHPQS